jgi:hypothetical protein
MNTATITADPRTADQRRADEDIADGYERFIVSDRRTGWTVHEATDERRKLAESAGPDNAIAAGGLNVPFLWRGGVYRITRARCSGGSVEVATAPADPAFIGEVKRRIEATPARVLTFYQGFGYVCFPEDYANYAG